MTAGSIQPWLCESCLCRIDMSKYLAPSVRGFGKLKVQRNMKNALPSGQMDVLDGNKASHQMMLLLL